MTKKSDKDQIVTNILKDIGIYSLRDLCKINNIKPATFYLWLGEDSDLKKRFEDAKVYNNTLYYDDLYANAKRALLDGLKDNNWISLKYVLEKMDMVKENSKLLIRKIADGILENVDNLNENQYTAIIDYLKKIDTEHNG